jgi:type I restriction enzyme M protein
MFAPYGFRLNQTIKSRRWQAFLTGAFPPISSILSLPKDIYQDVLFHSEVLFFNIPGLKPHDFFPG